MIERGYDYNGGFFFFVKNQPNGEKPRSHIILFMTQKNYIRTLNKKNGCFFLNFFKKGNLSSDFFQRK